VRLHSQEYLTLCRLGPLSILSAAGNTVEKTRGSGGLPRAPFIRSFVSSTSMGISAVHKYRSVGPIGREIIRGGAGELPSARLWKSLRLSRARARARDDCGASMARRERAKRWAAGSLNISRLSREQFSYFISRALRAITRKFAIHANQCSRRKEKETSQR